ncbi:HsdR family type I site-specific deoxyribonuclease [bacterium]|nr:HsdR family type I site-specific deoxyribonuclease [bacterium]
MNQELNEYTNVELPLIEQLKRMGWQHLEGDIERPDRTERQRFRQVLLLGRLRQAIRRINLHDGNPWLNESRIYQAITALERLGTHKLMEANQTATELLIRGVTVEGEPELHGDRPQTVHFIDYHHPERNDFLVLNQFRVDPPWASGNKDFIVPDLVLFVNGIPLVVIECKNPSITEPIEEGITQLLRYANQRDWIDAEEGAEALFHYNQMMITTSWYQARVGTISASYEHYLEWQDTSPVPMKEVAAEMGVENLSAQQILVAGLLRKENLLDIVRNFTLFSQSGGKTIKMVPRYQQFRAAQKAIQKLKTGQTRTEHGEFDQRGGIIWHTQGSGKSITMVFLVRKMRTLPQLRRFKVVVVTDRNDLEKQLSETATLTGETVRKANSTNQLKSILAEKGPDLVFAMIQKYQDRDLVDGVIEFPQLPSARERLLKVAEEKATIELFPILNDSEDILVLVDEAHRSHANTLHANLMRALPNCVRIGFTGTPIILGAQKRTHEIFGDFIDIYRLQDAESDGVIVPILYEGRTAEAEIDDRETLNGRFEDMFRERSPAELEAIKAKYTTQGNVLEAQKLIIKKAEDILRHYVAHVLPDGFKAMLVANSRRAAIRYQKALSKAHQALIQKLEAINPALLVLSFDEDEQLDDEEQFLRRAHAHLLTIRRLEFAAVISGDRNDDPAWKEWSDKARIDARVERFKKPLIDADPSAQDGLAFLCVKSMLLTGFDVPVAQVIYLDRPMKGHELLQAIARVNRPYRDKTHGLVLDYYGVANHLKEALDAYSAEDVEGTMTSIKDELPKLAERHREVLELFQGHGISTIDNVDACVELLRDVEIRAEFVVKLKPFLGLLNAILPRPEGLPYVQDAKTLGFINQSAANLYRDSQLNIMGVGHKVRELIDEHIVAHGIDPKVPPISILSDDFDRTVEAHTSPRAKAAEMEYAVRHHINIHLREDPARYRKLSEKLESILQAFEDNWDRLLDSLREFTNDVRQGPTEDETGLDSQIQLPFLNILIEEFGGEEEFSPERRVALAKLTIEIVEAIRQELQMVDFWRNTYAQNMLRARIVDILDQYDIFPFEQLEHIAVRIVDLAKARQGSLTK